MPTGNNLKGVTMTVPLGTFICITGVSGSGKSSLINQTLHPALAQDASWCRKNAAAVR
ncbi:MAG: hypothetical protein MZV63_69345 [Marinilabiliales bacterium]|nr:hypothetical protein [Marinilabiliales bacterium]